MSIGMQVEIANLRARCDRLENNERALYMRQTGVEQIAAEYYQANMALLKRIEALEGMQKPNPNELRLPSPHA